MRLYLRVIEPSPPPLCVPLGPFPLGPMRGSDGPEPAAQGPPEPSALRTDTHPWPKKHNANQLVLLFTVYTAVSLL